MVSGDMPPPELLGAAEPRGPCCIPFNMSSKPMVLSLSPAHCAAAYRRDMTVTRLGEPGTMPRQRRRTAPVPGDRNYTRFRKLIMTANRLIGIAGAGSIGC